MVVLSSVSEQHMIVGCVMDVSGDEATAMGLTRVGDHLGQRE